MAFPANFQPHETASPILCAIFSDDARFLMACRWAERLELRLTAGPAGAVSYRPEPPGGTAVAAGSGDLACKYARSATLFSPRNCV